MFPLLNSLTSGDSQEPILPDVKWASNSADGSALLCWCHDEAQDELLQVVSREAVELLGVSECGSALNAVVAVGQDRSVGCISPLFRCLCRCEASNRMNDDDIRSGLAKERVAHRPEEAFELPPSH